MRLSRTLLLAFTGVGLAGGAAAAGVVLRLGGAMQEVRARDLPALYAAQHMEGTVRAAVQSDLTYIATGDPLKKQRFLGDLARARAELAVIRNDTDPTARTLATRVAAACDRFAATASPAYTELDAMPVEAGPLADRLEAGGAWIDAANAFAVHKKEEVDTATSAWNASARTSAYVVAAALLLLALMTGGAVYRGRSRASLTGAGERIRGENDDTRAFDGPGRNLVQLATPFNPGVDEQMVAERTGRHVRGELRKSDDQIRRAQQLESLGRLAGGVAHDFNNLLTVIASNASALANDLSDPDAAAMVSDIVEAADQGGRLTGQLLDVSGANGCATIVDLDQVVANTTYMLRRVLGKGIEIVLQTSARGLIAADRAQIDQLVLNLVINARDATPAGGTITVRTADVAARAAFPQGAVMLSVKDTGCGMSAETQAHLFEPFFTTKEKGKGTGLGLATVYGVVRSGGGTIEVDSTLGVGSEFRVYLPRTGEAPRGSVRPAALVRVGAAKPTVLLVDDDASARTAAQGVLERAGYSVVTASHGDEALALVEAGRGFDVILSEVRMPVMGGLELARALDARSPPTRVVLMTRLAERTMHAEFPVLHKPLRDEDLLSGVSDVLEHPPTAGRMHATAASPHVKRGSSGSAVRLRAATAMPEPVPVDKPKG
jgi:signal transduction histidine kinase